VVSEIALSLVALVGAGLFIRSMRDAQRIDSGFESKNRFMMAFDLGALHYQEGRAQEFLRAAVERANSTPGVKSAAIASNFPLGGGFARTVFPDGEDETTGYRGTLTQLDDITSGFFDALKIPLLKGRVFSDSDRQGTTPVVVINEAMAKHFWPNQQAVGKRFHFFGDPTLREVVGVVGNTVINNIGEVPVPLAYLSITQDYSPAVTLQVRTTGSPEALIGGVRAHVLRFVVGQGLRLAGVGVLLGVILAVAVMRQLSGLLFGVSAYDPITFGAVAVLLVLVAFLACYVPARRATCVDPLVALRHE